MRLTRRAALAAPLLLGACRPAGRGDMAEPAGLGRFAPLGRFLDALAALEAGRATGPVTILQLGDSHTAFDAFSATLRDGLQARFGAGGRGLLPPGIPFRTYNPRGVSVAADAGWRALPAGAAGAEGPFGIAALRQRATAAGASITLAAEPGAFARAEIEWLRQPGGGTLEVQADAAPPRRLRSEGPRREAGFVKLPTTEATTRLRLTALGDGPVELLGLLMARAAPGVILANHGTIGATIASTARWDPATVAMEMAHLAPALLVIAFGTNEGFDPRLDIGAYGALFAARVGALAAAAPAASVLVIGPPDASMAPTRAGEPDGCGAGRLRPPHLDVVRAAQRAVAARQGWQFWDWQAAMGGACSMARFVAAEPPLALPDHVHLRAAGHALTASRLLEELMEASALRRRLG